MLISYYFLYLNSIPVCIVFNILRYSYIMELFYTNPANINAEEIVCDDFERKHISQALRKTQGETLFITDGQGHLYETKLLEQKPVLRLRIISQKKIPPAPAQLCLAIGFIRPNRLDFVLEKGTELGVNSFALIRSEYANYSSDNITRFEKITRQAIKQSQQYYLPPVEVFRDSQTFFEQCGKYALKIVAIDSKQTLLIEKLKKLEFDAPVSLCLLIGPEGGFSDKEIKAIAENGFQAVSLGKNRLRAETAAISAISIIQQYLQN